MLSHVTPEGVVRMVDISRKPDTLRTAKARGRVVLGPQAFAALQAQALHKGDVLAVARVAGIMGAKHTATLIPLCHQVALSSISVEFALDGVGHSVVVCATATTTGPTGVEMEALTAVSVASLTIYDMCKAVSRSIRIEDVHLISKTGGSGHVHGRDQPEPTSLT